MTLFPLPAATVAAEVFEEAELTTATLGQARARREGSELDELAYQHIEQAGGTILDVRVRLGAESTDAVTVDAIATGPNGQHWWVLAHGNVDVDTAADKPGLRRTDTIRKAGFSAAVLGRRRNVLPILVITSHLPTRTSADRAARSYIAELAPFVWDVINKNDLRSFHRLQGHLTAETPRRGTVDQWIDGGSWTQLALPFGVP